jgi:hypothetical protein
MTEVHLFSFSQVTSDFEEDVKALPTDVNATQAYFDFIETYGTHYASVAVMGAKAVIQSQVPNSSQWSNLKANDSQFLKF